MLFDCTAHDDLRRSFAVLFETVAAHGAAHSAQNFLVLNKGKLPLVAKFVDECRVRSLLAMENAALAASTVGGHSRAGGVVPQQL
jgi:hypothetical protein